jgi:hypothetical protein
MWNKKRMVGESALMQMDLIMKDHGKGIWSQGMENSGGRMGMCIKDCGRMMWSMERGV